MLANSPPTMNGIGALNASVQKAGTFREELVDFIENELPTWRDRPDRKAEVAETILTSQVCAHLNSAARRSPGWDILQFRSEEADEEQRGRKIDLVAAPVGCAIIIEGRRHTDFDPLMPIECKRLPTPKGTDRDEREYVISSKSTTGGIQRFKAGHHGSAHNFAAMIGYLQEDDVEKWSDRIDGWIKAVAVAEPGWSVGDRLSLHRSDLGRRVARLKSSHTRNNGLPDIELRHLWVGMA